MSSPIHHPEDLDAALIYAPPWARRKGSPPAEAPGGQPFENRRRGFSGDRAVREVQRQLALNPDAVPQPPLESAADLWPIVLRLSVVATAAALVAWGMVALTSTQRARNQSAQTNVSAASGQPAWDGVHRVKLVHFPAATLMPPLVPERLTPVTGQRPQAEAPSEPPANVAPPSAAAAPSAGTVPALDDEEIATLVKRGQDLLQNGDLASARLLLRRAADAGNANAALALGATFDPLVIQRLGAIGIGADAGRARQWYERAAQLGSAVASQQLAKLEGAR